MIPCSLTLTLYEISNSRESTESTTTTTTDTTTTMRGPSISIWYNCTIAGEGSGNNPDYCFAFYEKKDSVTSEAEEEDDLDCCWTANERSTLSPLLRDVVTVHENGTM